MHRLFQRIFVVVLCLPLGLTTAFTQDITYSQQTCTGGSYPDCDSGKVPNSYFFSVDNLDGDSTDFTYFWDFGDGHFSNVLSPKHTFRQTGTYTVSVEITRVAGNGYDDDLPPDKAVSDPINVDTLSGLKLPDVPDLNFSGPLDLYISHQPVTRDPEPGDTVTYVIRVRNICFDDRQGDPIPVVDQLKFYYNPNAFEAIASADVSTYFFSPPAFTEATVGTGTNIRKELTWDLSNLNLDDSLVVFVRLQVKSALAEGTKTKVSSSLADDTGNKISGAFCNGNPTVAVSTEDVAFSHDPNVDIVSQELICPGYIPDYLDYTIQFQNTGAGDARRVEITVYFDDHMNINSLDALNARVGPDAFGAQEMQLTRGNGFAIWTFEDTELWGTKRANLAPSLIDSTRGFIKFRIGFAREPLPCSAIFNRASIVFDCNPPVHTAPSIVRVGCEEIEDCNDCPEMITSAEETIPQKWSDFSYLDQDHRFPMLHQDRAPGLLTVGRKLQYQTGDSTCFRSILDVDIPDCKLEIESTLLQPDGCGEPAGYRLNIRNGTAPFQWQDCAYQSTGSLYESPVLPPGTYKMMVTDADGCVGKAEVTIPQASDLSYYLRDQNPTSSTEPKKYFLSIAGGKTPYTYTVSDATGTEIPQATPYTIIASSGDQLLIEDANGCQVVHYF